MEQEFVKHCHDKNARFNGLIRKEFMHMAFEFSDLNDLSHTLKKGKTRAKKDWVRDFC
jgi:hypothetical protein